MQRGDVAGQITITTCHNNIWVPLHLLRILLSLKWLFHNKIFAKSCCWVLGLCRTSDVHSAGFHHWRPPSNNIVQGPAWLWPAGYRSECLVSAVSPPGRVLQAPGMTSDCCCCPMMSMPIISSSCSSEAHWAVCTVYRTSPACPNRRILNSLNCEAQH